ncbi:MAG: hypothetical protein ACYTEQ_15365 [Planctomycetota bacterium]|jgi:hypothetical protein
MKSNENIPTRKALFPNSKSPFQLCNRKAAQNSLEILAELIFFSSAVKGFMEKSCKFLFLFQKLPNLAQKPLYFTLVKSALFSYLNQKAVIF